MAYALEFLERLEAIDVVALVSDIARDNSIMIADANRLRLTEGKNAEGGYLPKYIDDPYFKTIAQAKGYEAYKAKISPNKNKPREIMDFYINGYTHSNIVATVSGAEIQTTVKTGWAQHLEEVEALGINPESARELWNFAFMPLLCEEISNRTGIPFQLPEFAMR